MITDIGREERTTKRAALYARVSTLNHGQDPEVQLRELREFCQRRRFEIAVEYVDKGISGSRERRPSLDKLMTACRKRLVDAVVVYRYDRFARSLRQLVLALEEFRSLGIDFISLHEGVDTSTPNGRLIFGIFASIAEFERELIRDRVRSGLAESPPCVGRGARGRRSRTTPRSAKARHKGQWLACPKPLLQPAPKCLIYRTPRGRILTAQNHPIVGSCPCLPLGNLQGVIPP